MSEKEEKTYPRTNILKKNVQLDPSMIGSYDVQKVMQLLSSHISSTSRFIQGPELEIYVWDKLCPKETTLAQIRKLFEYMGDEIGFLTFHSGHSGHSGQVCQIVRRVHEPLMSVFEVVRDLRARPFLLKNRIIMETNLWDFFQHLSHCGLFLTQESMNLSKHIMVGMKSMSLFLNLATNPRTVMKHAMIQKLHQDASMTMLVLLNKELQAVDFPRLCSSQIQTYTSSKELRRYMWEFVLCVPDMVRRGIPKHCKIDQEIQSYS